MKISKPECSPAHTTAQGAESTGLQGGQAFAFGPCSVLDIAPRCSPGIHGGARCGGHAHLPAGPAPGCSGSSAGRRRRRRTPAAGWRRGRARDPRWAQRRSRRGGGRARGLGGPNHRAPRRGRATAAQSGPSAPRLQGAPGVTNAEPRGAEGSAGGGCHATPGGARRRQTPPPARKGRGRQVSSEVGAPLPRLAGPWTPTVPTLRGVPGDGGLGLPAHPARSRALGLPAPPSRLPPASSGPPHTPPRLCCGGPRDPQKPSTSQPFGHHPSPPPTVSSNCPPSPRRPDRLVPAIAEPTSVSSPWEHSCLSSPAVTAAGPLRPPCLWLRLPKLVLAQRRPVLPLVRCCPVSAHTCREGQGDPIVID